VSEKVKGCQTFLYPHGWKKRPKKEQFYQVIRGEKSRFAGSLKTGFYKAQRIEF